MGNSNSSNTNKPLKITILGASGSGKTTLVNYLETGTFQETQDKENEENEDEEIGSKWVTVNYSELNMKIFDMGFSDETEMESQFFIRLLDLEALFFMIDSCDHESLEGTSVLFHKLMLMPELRGVPVVIFATKQDLRELNPVPPETLKQIMYLQRIRNKVEIFPCDARTGSGVQAAVEWLKKRVRKSSRTGSTD